MKEIFNQKKEELNGKKEECKNVIEKLDYDIDDEIKNNRIIIKKNLNEKLEG